MLVVFGIELAFRSVHNCLEDTIGVVGHIDLGEWEVIV